MPKNSMPIGGNYPEGDAHTLAEAHAIHADSKRHKAAQTAAKGLHKDLAAKATGMRMVARAKANRTAHEQKWFGNRGLGR
jgi:hypothetical protein